jgi:hypothetical protein
MPVANRFPQHKLLQPEGLTNAESAKLSNKHAPKPIERRRVHFKETVSVRPITHVDNIPTDEVAAVWFCKKDFEDMKKSFATTLRLIAYGELKGDDSEHCARGLEFRTRVGALARRENKWNALNAVLDEQDRQRELGISNDKLLSQIYITENRLCRQSALELARRDEVEARQFHITTAVDDDVMADSSSESDEEMDYCQEYAPRSTLRASSQRKTSPGKQE